jgi:hypothetical protein
MREFLFGVLALWAYCAIGVLTFELCLIDVPVESRGHRAYSTEIRHAKFMGALWPAGLPVRLTYLAMHLNDATD